MFTKYYQDELQYLRELGEEFAQAHPEAAHYLSGPGRDPDVERLLEGFAFLSAQVRQKIDDEYPELVHGMFHLLWPHYLRPVPACSILEFAPVFAALRQSQVVGRGCEVQSVPVEGTPCRFSTCFDVPLHPLSLDDVALETRTSGASRLRLSFRLWNKARLEDLEINRIRLFLNGDRGITEPLYLALCQQVEDVRLVQTGAPSDSSIRPPRAIAVEPAGFAEDEALLPYRNGSLPAYRYLQEYYALPAKFLFVDLVGLKSLTAFPGEERFDLEIRFDRELPSNLRPTTENIKLYCTPIINLFDQEGDPLRLDRQKTEYRVRPSGKDPFHREIFELRRVAAYRPGSAEEREIPSFQAFQTHAEDEAPAFYHARLRPSVIDERLDTYVSFIDARGGATLPEAETVSFELTCTNRRLPEALRIGDIEVPTDSSPAFVQFKNLTVPTRSVAPPLGDRLPWRLISHMSLNHASLTSLDALRGVLDLYNFHAARDPQASRAHRLRLEGIQAIDATGGDHVSGGAVVRGTNVRLEILEDHFANLGDAYLFGSILNEFMALHATLNAYVQLEVHGLQQGETWSWPHRIGRDRL